MTENKNLNQIFDDLFSQDQTQDTDTAIPRNQWSDYLFLPQNLHGFYDTRPLFDISSFDLSTSVYTAMAAHCIRLNRTLMMLCWGMKKRDTLQPAMEQFEAVSTSTLECIGKYIFYHSDNVYKLPFKRRDLPKNPEEASQVAGQMLYDLAMKELEQALAPWPVFTDELLLCHQEFCAYLGQSLAAFLVAAQQSSPSFIAYPFCCYDLFSHVNEAEGHTSLIDIDYDCLPEPRGQAMDESFDNFPTVHCISAIHIPTLTKQDLYMEDGALYQIHWWNPLGDFPCVISEEAPQFDLDDMDDYV